MIAYRLTGSRCRCSRCGELFNSVSVFDRHRVGSFADRGIRRECMTPAGMFAKAWQRNLMASGSSANGSTGGSRGGDQPPPCAPLGVEMGRLRAVVSRRKRKHSRIESGRGYALFYDELIQSEAWRALPHFARSVFAGIAAQFGGANNGDLDFPVSKAKSSTGCRTRNSLRLYPCWSRPV